MQMIDNKMVVQRGRGEWVVFDRSGDRRLGVVTLFDESGIPPVYPQFYAASGTRNVFSTLEEAVSEF